MKASATAPAQPEKCPLGRTTSYGYDDKGNLTSVSGPDGTQSRAEYNELGLPTVVVDPDGAQAAAYRALADRLAAAVSSPRGD